MIYNRASAVLVWRQSSECRPLEQLLSQGPKLCDKDTGTAVVHMPSHCSCVLATLSGYYHFSLDVNRAVCQEEGADEVHSWCPGMHVPALVQMRNAISCLRLLQIIFKKTSKSLYQGKRIHKSQLHKTILSKYHQHNQEVLPPASKV